jgi:diguanylate cyclase (GGDEF)-like protein
MNQNILVIDDSKEIHSLVNAMLSDEPVEIHSAFNGESGLTHAASIRPDVILLDVEMPGINGYEVCRRLKTDPDLFNTPVIFLTALCTTEEKVRGLELGAVDYVTKPFSPTELLARVRASLRSHRAIQMLEHTSLVDFLTGLGNRAMFKQRLAAEVALRVRTQKPLSCIVVDVDNFQAINDVQGHPFGDRVLQAIGATLRAVCRIEDVACRLGGDSFVVLMPNTEIADATLLAARIESSLNALEFNEPASPVEVRFNVAVAPSIALYDRTMCERANQAIEEARERGQSGVILATAEITEDSPVMAGS